ncbi:MAG: sulfatase [Flavobacteriaceae bacterium]
MKCESTPLSGFCLLKILLLMALLFTISCEKPEKEKPNVLLIMIDDLNDCIETLKGHPQSLTPNMNKLARSGVSFLNAHTNAPMCGPSRSSMMMGVYPHHSLNFFQAPWFKNPVLKNTRSLSEQFRQAGYQTIGTGKVLHHLKKENWDHYENPPDYGPMVWDGNNRLAHPDVPRPFYDIGSVDGSLGPLIDLQGKTNEKGQPLQWIYGYRKQGVIPMRYFNDEDRDPTPDEMNATWTAQKIKSLAVQKLEKPFFLAVGFLRPHTPLIAPQKYFDRFPLEKIEVTLKKEKDREDTFLEISYQKDQVFTLGMGIKMFDQITASYGSEEAGLKRWTQAYLACVAAVDENVGQVLNALNQTVLKDNTIVVLASDHGFHMGEKDYLYKNSLWEKSTRVPLIIRVPGVTKANTTVGKAVSLIDVYPTLMDLCGLSFETQKNETGHALDGYSMKELLENPTAKNWKGERPALTAVYAGGKYKGKPHMQHYAIKTDRYRYILYNNGKEELYDHQIDPNEWDNLVVSDKENESLLVSLRQKMIQMLNPIQLNGLKNKKLQ